MSSRKALKSKFAEGEEEAKSMASKHKKSNQVLDTSNNDISIMGKTDSGKTLDLSKQSLQNVEVALDDYLQGEDKEDPNNLLSFVRTLILSTNAIESIDCLKNHPFKKLRKLFASDNLLQEIDTKLPSLKYLDISKNSFEYIPQLENFPKLQRLNLSHNEIKHISGKEFSVAPKLKIIDISYNKLNKKPKQQDTKKFLDNINKLTHLKRFYCHHNAMFDDEKFLRELKNSAKISSNRYEVNPEAKFDDKLTSGFNKTGEGKYMKYTLSEMCALIEKVNSVPSQSKRYLTELLAISNNIKENLEEAEQNFNKNTEGDEQEKYFIQNAEMIAETGSNCRENIVMILINLGHLNANNFGTKCFAALQDLMSSSKESDKEKLIEHVISKFKESDDQGAASSKSVPINSNLPVLKGLYHIIEKQKCSEILTKLYENDVFLNWLKEIVHEKENESDYNSKFSELKNKRNEEVQKWRIGLISISLCNSDKNIKDFSGNKKMKDCIIKLFNRTKPVDEKYIFLLRIIQYTAEKNYLVANDYMAEYIDEKFKYKIRDKLVIYKKFDALSENEEEEKNKTEADRQLEFKILAAQIDCLGGLLNAQTPEMEAFLKYTVHEEILSILSLYQADPLLLLSCAKYAKMYFSHRDVITNTILLEMRLPKIDNCTKLLPYLGGTSFEKALKQCDKYLNLEAVSNAKNDKMDLSDQHNSLMNELLIAIINLIELVCKEAVRKTQKSHIYFKEISDILNDHDREKYLFYCFSIPSDEVKLALVNCILHVPLKELELEEINYLMKVVSESKNIGAGKAEEIISIIFLIFINLITDKENTASNNFRIKYGKSAISHCLEILLKNQKRKIEEEEEAEEKLMLSISCLYFLKEASRASDMKKFMSEPDFVPFFTENLLAEQNYSFKSHKRIPIEIEYTSLGNSFLTLRDCLAGTKALEPFTPVSFRVIQQIANVLQNYDTTKFNVLKSSQSRIISKMKNSLIQGLQIRIKLEMDLWKEGVEEKYHKDTHMNKDLYNSMVEQHSSFAENSGLYMLVLFLTKKKSKRYATIKDEEPEKNPLLVHEISDNYAMRYKTFEKDYSTWIKYKDSNRIEREQMIERGELFESKSKSNRDVENIEKLRKALQKQKILTVSFYDNNFIEDKSLYLGQHIEEDTPNEITKNEDSDEDDDDVKEVSKLQTRQEIENATVAAFLRIIYSSIRFSPVDEYRDKIISQLYDIHILKKITLLCYKSGWTIGNIGLKYLKIIRNAIELDDINDDAKPNTKSRSKQSRQKPSKILTRLQFYEIIAKSIREILKEVNSSFSTKKSNDIQEYKKELGLLAEIAQCCKLMVERCSTFELGDLRQDYNEITSEDYHKDYNPKYGARHRDTDSYVVIGHGDIDIRTPQQRTLDWIISSLIHKDTVTTLIKYCMYKFEYNEDDLEEESDEEKHSDLDSDDSDDEEEKVSTLKPGMKTERTRGRTAGKASMSGYEAASTYKVTFEMKELERFKDNLKVLIGEYLSKCKASQYEIIETFMRIQVFDDNEIDQDFLNDVLELRKTSKAKSALHTYMKKQNMMMSESKKSNTITPQEDTATDTGTKKSKTKNVETQNNDEYIKIMATPCFISVNNSFLRERILVLTNIGIYILQESSKSKCEKCPPEMFCPEGPSLESTYKYNKVLDFDYAKSVHGKNHEYSLVISVPKEHKRSVASRTFGFFSSSTPTEQPTATPDDDDMTQIFVCFADDSVINSTAKDDKAVNLINSAKNKALRIREEVFHEIKHETT